VSRVIITSDAHLSCFAQFPVASLNAIYIKY